MPSHRSSTIHVLVGLLVLCALTDPSGSVGEPSSPMSVPILVATYTFDDGVGGPDPQAWQPLIFHQQTQAFFHVEDFSGIGHEAAPLEGTKSMWCGLTAEDPRTCHWPAAPGYGNTWNQDLVSAEFNVTGDVTISFLVNYDIEAGYDFTYLQYEDNAGAWTTVTTYNGGPTTALESHVVPGAAHDGTIRFRFNFTSDGAVSDENPLYGEFHEAFLVDSLTVTDATGVVDFQDFESEAVNDSVTADGDWTAVVNTDATNAGGLVDGSVTVQEDPVITNNSYMWAFIEGSTTTYACGGHPTQAATPPGIGNEVRSPLIDITKDSGGHPIVGDADSIRVSFDVYRDVAPAKSYFWRVAYYVNGCFEGRDRQWLSGTQKDWYRHHLVLTPPPGTTEIDIRLAVIDQGSSCASHAPLFDNVTVERFGGVVTSVPDTPPPPIRFALHQNTPNPFNPTTRIAYDVPVDGERVTLRIYDVAGRLVRTLADGVESAGAKSLTWDGTKDRGAPVTSGVYFYRLTAGSFSDTRKMLLMK